MIKKISAKDRYHSKMGWLSSYHLFSFGNYYDAQNVNFGALRVFNDDRVDAFYGFDEHPHRDAEIVTIMLEGTITHRDSMGNVEKIKEGEVQRMSAGTGVVHAEKNLEDMPVHLFQVWFLPKRGGIEPSYAQADFSYKLKQNSFNLLVKGVDEPQGSGVFYEESLTMFADADMHRALFEAGNSGRFDIGEGRGVFVYVHKGILQIGDMKVETGDQLRISDESSFDFEVVEDSDFMLIEIGLD